MYILKLTPIGQLTHPKYPIQENYFQQVHKLHATVPRVACLVRRGTASRKSQHAFRRDAVTRLTEIRCSFSRFRDAEGANRLCRDRGVWRAFISYFRRRIFGCEITELFVLRNRVGCWKGQCWGREKEFRLFIERGQSPKSWIILYWNVRSSSCSDLTWTSIRSPSVTIIHSVNNCHFNPYRF